MSGSERAHLGESPAWLGRDYLADVVGRRTFVSAEDRDRIVEIMESRFASAMAERVAEGTAVVAGLRPGPRRSGRFPIGRRASGRDLVALGEAFWYTEDPVFVRIFCELLSVWSAEPASRAANHPAPWHRAAEIIGWSLGTQCMLPSSFLLERDATRLLEGLEREGRILAGWLHHHQRPARERAAALAGLAFLGMLYPEAFGEYGWLDEGLGELALSADAYLAAERPGLAPVDALQVYVPLVALSIRNGLDVPGSVLAGVEEASRELGRSHRAGDESGPSLVPLIPSGVGRIEALRLSAAAVLGKLDNEPDIDDAASGLLLLLGPDLLMPEEASDLDIVRGSLAARALERPYLDSADPAA